MRNLIRALLLGLFTVASLPVEAGSASSQHPASPKVYVPIGDANQVLVIDPKTDKIIGAVSGTDAAHGLAGVPVRDLLIVGSYAESDATGPAKPQGISEDEHASHHPKKSKNLVNTKDSKSFVTIVKAADRRVLRRIAVPGAVHHVAITPDGLNAIVTHPNSNEIGVIDLRTFQLKKRILTGDTPNYVVTAPDSNTVYVSNAGNNTVSEVDLDAGIVRRNFVVGESPEHLILSADGRRLFVANADGGTVSEIATGSGALVRTLTIGGGLHGIDLSADGRRLLVVGRETDKLVAIDLATGNLRSSRLAPEPYHLKAIHGTGKLYVSSADQDKIWVVDEKTLKVTKEITIPDRAHQIAVF
ncbi:MAG: beta-propeller fold lactonase family protein [Rhodospirillaceae bacterium]|jgi:DNA-binding beta-propeller fold protein YncE|nr:beta-propeller fold lactonase family protein [Rhodospirillaceae bacterium]MBT5456945.1 beta-propeller fold lactonase family protein [Rhodospirillaceae bacterium]